MKLIKTQHIWWYHFIKAFIKIFDSLTPLLTLGFYWTNFEYKFTKWFIFK